jgi:hypothetical protein
VPKLHHRRVFPPTLVATKSWKKSSEFMEGLYLSDVRTLQLKNVLDVDAFVNCFATSINKNRR